MACCGRGKSMTQPARQVSVSRPARQIPSAMPVARQIPTQTTPPSGPSPSRPAPRAIATNISPAKSVSNKFCEKCGWMMKVSRYPHPVSGQIIENFSCTNRRCYNYR